MLGATAAVAGEAAGGARKGFDLRRLDPFHDEDSEERTGWVTNIPKALRILSIADILAGGVVFLTQHVHCSVPLRTWLLGGIALGFPTSYLVKLVASRGAPVMKHFRLKVTKLRGGGDVRTFKTEGLALYDRFMNRVNRIENMEEFQGEFEDADKWTSIIKSGPMLIKAYQVITHTRADPSLDPVAWTLEGSCDGLDWTVLDEVQVADVPRARGRPTALFDELMHQQSANIAFRTAFLAEVFANLAAFAWLVIGTAWVGAGSVDCVDSAPLLFYSCYLLIVIVWSFLGTITIALVLSAVAMVLMGSRTPAS